MMAYAVAVMALIMCLTLEGCGLTNAQDLSSSSSSSAFVVKDVTAFNAKKEEFANNLKRCVVSHSLDTCLANTLEEDYVKP